jgi:uncharacterized membrane protein YedE/YeeE
MDVPVYVQVLVWGFGLAVLLGALINKTNFCTMGAVSDVVSMGHTGRMRAWVFAIATAMTGVLIIESLGVFDLDKTMPPYRTSNFDWLRYLLGGTMFGVGMTLASGCVNKTLIRIGGGNMKSLVVLLFGGIMAYLMTMTDFYHYAFHIWINPTSIELSRFDIESQQLSAIVAGLAGMPDSGLFHWTVGGLVIAGLLYWIFRSRDFYGQLDNIIGGLSVGVLVVAAWYLTGGPLGQAAIEEASFMEFPPRGVGVMSFTFVNPMGETLNYLVHPANLDLFTFGVAILLGVIAGSFLYSIVTGKFRFEWFSSAKDFYRHVIGGLLMGTGGVLAMGCTIGQGVTGLSTMALGSALAFVTFIFGSALTMKFEYYKMLYENKASYTAILLTSLADMRLLPRSAKRLEQ